MSPALMIEAAPRANDPPRVIARADDTVLLEALRAGDRDAAERFARAMYPRMLAAARRLLPREHDAQDAVQNAFVKVITNLHGFRGDAAFSTWVLRIVVNEALMQRRAAGRERRLAVESLLPRFERDGHLATPVAPGDDGGPDDEPAALAAMVRSCVQDLPDAYRTVVLLRDVEGLDTAETASVLGIRPGAVKVRLHRARMALRQLIDDRSRAANGPQRCG